MAKNALSSLSVCVENKCDDLRFIAVSQIQIEHQSERVKSLKGRQQAYG
jgi:hypothetical protein